MQRKRCYVRCGRGDERKSGANVRHKGDSAHFEMQWYEKPMDNHTSGGKEERVTEHRSLRYRLLASFDRI
ncbi:hypothetical protein F2P81_007381 [Scophthalmus maximus]|uniref:Uncharacterized protein n=1 Tax=Scophthalmus maximus TaxID=52904 RepID=A0A6A4T655_SCOMX|nr:hypothetical protein F2P81_007381 [Scophthalmus maximus]